MGITTILFLLIRGGFQPSNIYVSQAENCLQNIYGLSQSMIYAGLTQKGLQQEDMTIFPEQYHIYVDTTEQKIQTAYDTIIDQEIFLTSNNRGCHSNNYQVLLTGSNTHIYIQQTNMIANSFTGNIYFNFCQQGECHPLGTIYYDTRSHQLQVRLCGSDQTDFCL